MQKLFLGESEILRKGYQNKTNTACEGELAFHWHLELKNILHNFVIKKSGLYNATIYRSRKCFLEILKLIFHYIMAKNTGSEGLYSNL